MSWQFGCAVFLTIPVHFAAFGLDGYQDGVLSGVPFFPLDGRPGGRIYGAIGGDPNAMNVPLAILYILFLLAMIPVQLKVMTYQAGWALLYDDETRSVWDATREASATFKGQFGKLFAFVLSFLGWMILTVGVAYLCVGLGMAGLFMVQGGTGIAIFALCCVAAFCLLVLLGAFTNTYQMTSFFGMHEFLCMPPVQPQGMPPVDSWPGQDNGMGQ